MCSGGQRVLRHPGEHVCTSVPLRPLQVAAVCVKADDGPVSPPDSECSTVASTGKTADFTTSHITQVTLLLR